MSEQTTENDNNEYGEGEFIVEAVVGHKTFKEMSRTLVYGTDGFNCSSYFEGKTTHSKYVFLLKWAGWPDSDNTWEEEANCENCHLVKTYKADNNLPEYHLKTKDFCVKEYLCDLVKKHDPRISDKVRQYVAKTWLQSDGNKNKRIVKLRGTTEQKQNKKKSIGTSAQSNIGRQATRIKTTQRLSASSNSRLFKTKEEKSEICKIKQKIVGQEEEERLSQAYILDQLEQQSRTKNKEKSKYTVKLPAEKNLDEAISFRQIHIPAEPKNTLKFVNNDLFDSGDSLEIIEEKLNKPPPTDASKVHEELQISKPTPSNSRKPEKAKVIKRASRFEAFLPKCPQAIVQKKSLPDFESMIAAPAVKPKMNALKNMVKNLNARKVLAKEAQTKTDELKRKVSENLLANPPKKRTNVQKTSISEESSEDEHSSNEEIGVSLNFVGPKNLSRNCREWEVVVRRRCVSAERLNKRWEARQNLEKYRQLEDLGWKLKPKSDVTSKFSKQANLVLDVEWNMEQSSWCIKGEDDVKDFANNNTIILSAKNLKLRELQKPPISAINNERSIEEITLSDDEIIEVWSNK